jgi:hypothetical protein
MKYYISIDYTETKPIAYSHLVALAFGASTDNDYADYLQYVLSKAKRIANNVEEIQFSIHETGCVVPFGEGSYHPYSKNFYSWVELPDFEIDPRKAR